MKEFEMFELFVSPEAELFTEVFLTFTQIYSIKDIEQRRKVILKRASLNINVRTTSE